MFNAVYIEEGVNNENLIIDLIEDNAQRFLTMCSLIIDFIESMISFLTGSVPY